MDRRNFLKVMSVAPLIALSPSLATAKNKTPQTCKELYDAINGLCIQFPQRSKKAYENVGAITYIHQTYAVTTKPSPFAEKELVKALWDDMQKIILSFNGRPTIFWRLKPSYEDILDFGSNKAGIYMRASIGARKIHSRYIKAEGEQAYDLTKNRRYK